MTTQESPDPVRTALYLDFDNLHAGLQKDHKLAEAFCHDTRSWLRRIETGSGAPAGGRRILVARAYLNPAAHSSKRSALTKAGFEVIDTPSLTSEGKSAADIRLAIDVLDALAGPVRYDEFIVLSGDADFTPLFHRLRANDRRTMIISSKPIAGAYRNVADLVVDGKDLPELLGVRPGTEVRPAAAAGPASVEAPAVINGAGAIEAAPVDIDPAPAILEALATVIEAGRAFDGSLAAAVVAELAASGRVVPLGRVRQVLGVFGRAGVDVRRAAEPTATALRRTYDTFSDEPNVSAA